MPELGRRAIEAPYGAESLRGLAWRLRMATVRGRLDVHNPRRESVRAAIERRFSHQNPKQIECRYVEYVRRRALIIRWLRQGMEQPERLVEIEGLSHLEEALSSGAGAILASAHFGHGRLIKPILSGHGWSALLVGFVEASGDWPPIAAEDLPVGLNLRPHCSALRENRPLIILVDGHAVTSPTYIGVGGIEVGLGPGTMRIARAAGAPVLPTFVSDEGTLRDPLAIRLRIHPPLTLQSSADEDADLLENLRRFAAVYAEELERNPHNINWRFVQSQSGQYSPPPGPQPGGIANDRTRDIADASQRARPVHGR